MRPLHLTKGSECVFVLISVFMIIISPHMCIFYFITKYDFMFNNFADITEIT
jgi:hypothetical protein